MATLTIRNIDDQVKARLRINAAQHGVSMEEEVRQTLTRAVMSPANDPDSRGLATRIRDTMAELNIKGFELEIPPREPIRDPPDFSGFFETKRSTPRASRQAANPADKSAAKQ